MATKALVISGGGSKGAFAVGAIEHMVDVLGLQFDFVAGTSTGAAIAPLVVTGEIAELVRIYTSVKTADILRSRRLKDLLKANSLYDVRPLQTLIEATVTPARALQILGSQVQMALTTVCLQTGKVTYFTSGPPLVAGPDVSLIPLQNRIQLTRAVLASSDQPVLMPPVQIPKPQGAGPVRQYVDGGVREVAPLKIAIDNGATEIYAIILSPEQKETKDKRFQGLKDVAGRTVGLFVDDVVANDVRIARLYNDALNYWEGILDRLKTDLGLSDQAAQAFLTIPNTPNPFGGGRSITLHVIRPKKSLPTDGLDFDPVVMSNMMQQGRDRAKELLGP